MKKPQFTIRDLIAAPFFFVSWLFHMMAIQIGGAWTSFITLKIMGLRD